MHFKHFVGDFGFDFGAVFQFLKGDRWQALYLKATDCVHVTNHSHLT